MNLFRVKRPLQNNMKLSARTLFSFLDHWSWLAIETYLLSIPLFLGINWYTRTTFPFHRVVDGYLDWYVVTNSWFYSNLDGIGSDNLPIDLRVLVLATVILSVCPVSFCIICCIRYYKKKRHAKMQEERSQSQNVQ